MYFGRHTAVDTIAQTLLVANGIVEARANGAHERSIERDEEEDLGGQHVLLQDGGTSNASMMTWWSAYLSQLVL